MKYLYILALLFLFSCNDNVKKKDFENLPLSKSQKGIQDLIDSFKIEYKAATTDILKDSTINKYNVRLFNYLIEDYIDSIRVHVDSVIINGLTVTTKFHCNKDISFKYGLTFRDSMNKDEDSLFHFMKALKPGIDTIINFAYMGSHELNNPFDTSMPTLRIFAFPTPQFSKRP